MNSPTSKFIAAVRNAMLTISLTTVLSIASLVAAKRKKEGKDTATAPPAQAGSARRKDDIPERSSHSEARKDVNDQDKHEDQRRHEAEDKGEKAEGEDKKQDKHEDDNDGNSVQ